MFLEAIVLGIIIGLVRNGSITNIGIMKIRGWYLVILAFFLQIATLIFDNLSFFKSYGRYFYIASVLLIILTLIINLDKKGMWIILTGALLNFIAILMNQWKMPIDFEGLRLAGLGHMVDKIISGEIVNYVALEKVVNWTKHLGKYIVIPRPYLMAKVISIGDIFMSLGIIFFIQGEMTRSYLTLKNRMVRMGYKSKL
ncbi:MAG: DUF5317 domain-containing protein [Clostridia bacterium]|nr:DUF5317 domain-containing protein [Clostridia bacterium]